MCGLFFHRNGNASQIIGNVIEREKNKPRVSFEIRHVVISSILGVYREVCSPDEGVDVMLESRQGRRSQARLEVGRLYFRGSHLPSSPAAFYTDRKLDRGQRQPRRSFILRDGNEHSNLPLAVLERLLFGLWLMTHADLFTAPHQ